MLTYRNASNSRRWIRRLGVVVDSWETFQRDRPINDANFEEVKDKKAAGTSGKED